MAELVDAPDLGSGAVRCGGSSPPFRTKLYDITESNRYHSDERIAL